MMLVMKVEFENKVIEFNVQYGRGKKLSIHIDSFGFITRLKFPMTQVKT